MSKGQKTGGRVEGSVNKTTKEMKELFLKFTSDNFDEAVKEWKILESKDKVKLYLDFAKYVLPTAKEIEINGSLEQKELTPEEREKMKSIILKNAGK